MFSGTVFYAGQNGALQVAPISWVKETRFRLPVAVWKEMMDLYYPNSAWLCLRRVVFDRLHQSKVEGQEFPPGRKPWRGCWRPSEEAVSAANARIVEKRSRVPCPTRATFCTLTGPRR